MHKITTNKITNIIEIVTNKKVKVKIKVIIKIKVNKKQEG